MTGDLTLDLAISLAGVAALVAVSWMLGGWRTMAIDEAAARDRLSFDEPDFVVGEWFFSADRKSAAALSTNREELAIVFAVGDGAATRRVKIGRARISVSGAVVTVALGDLSARKIGLRARDATQAAAWAGGLAGRVYSDEHGVS